MKGNRQHPSDQAKDLPSIPSSLHPHKVPPLGPVGSVPANERKNGKR